MTTMAFVYLARNAEPTFENLAHEIAAMTRSGDRVVIVDDGSTDDTPNRIGRFGMQEGWGPDVTVLQIITGTPAAGDTGIALNLALAALAVPGMTPDRVAVFAAGTRIDPVVFSTVRAKAETESLDLLVFPLWQYGLDPDTAIDPAEAIDWPARPGESPRAHALRRPPSVFRMILRWSLLAGPPALRATEGTDGHSDLELVWTAIRRAGRIGVTDTPLGRGPHPAASGHSTLANICDLVLADPMATDWAIRQLPHLLAGISATDAAALLASLDGEGLATAVGLIEGRSGSEQLGRDIRLPPALIHHAQDVLRGLLGTVILS